MSDLEPFINIYEEVRVFKRNLKKDNQDRRSNLAVYNQNCNYLENIKKDFAEVKLAFNSAEKNKEDVEKAKKYVASINSYILEIIDILKDRQDRLENYSANDNIENNLSSGNMSEFDLRTASSLLPQMEDSENSVKQLMDAIELYDSFLNADGKKLLINYVLKVKLSQNAKMRLKNSYNNTNDLIGDMKKHLLTKKSAAALSNQLHTAKQNNKTIDEFGKSLEELMLNLTLAESSNEAETRILTATNEKLAINAFANGLRDNNLKIIVKSRNYTTLREAIVGAMEEDISRPDFQSHQVFFSNSKKYGSFNSRNRSSFSHFRGNRYSHNAGERHAPVFQNSYRGARQQNFRSSRHSRGQWRSRTRGRGTHRSYVVTHTENSSLNHPINSETPSDPSSSNRPMQFFRVAD